VDAVIETMRGHTLGRIIHEGSAIPDTAVPGAICGFTKERVYHAPADGCFHAVRRIGDIVRKDDPIAYVETAAGEKILIRAKIAGLIRGMLRDGFTVTAGFKTADIDPRESELSNCYTISDKARCIAGSVLEEVCARRNRAGDGGKH
jgi:xanthine dehydrogenase accessory factor